MGAACRRLLATWRPLATYWRPGDLLATSGCQCTSMVPLILLATCWQPAGDLATWRPGDLATTGDPLATYWRLLLATWRPGAQPKRILAIFILRTFTASPHSYSATSLYKNEARAYRGQRVTAALTPVMLTAAWRTVAAMAAAMLFAVVLLGGQRSSDGLLF